MSNDEILANWWKVLTAELGIETDADPQALLDLAGTAAHSIVRPAAPLTTFLVGYAAGLAGTDSKGLADLIDLAEKAAEDFE
ncbi:MAG TPA: DUF6457 domain-containing protein [Aeromicrobium sp.]|nr:DUF6457 domain-containing protein [Aeromicrobium sp.]